MSNKNQEIKHIAIIMDGNRRWAKKNGLKPTEGHKAGTKALEKIIESFQKRGIQILTVFAFSTENWNRSKREVNFIMNLLKKSLKNKIKKFHEQNIKLIVSGRLKDLSKDLRNTIEEAINLTKDNTDGILNIALNYGGREEIINAIKKLAIESKEEIKNLTEETFTKYLYTGNLPDPDLMIRTSGEQRISNFLPWQLAYTEFYFSSKYWPDFNAKDLDKAITEYKKRQRRFGGN
jgi:undecaprenyl diphosphate synthase